MVEANGGTSGMVIYYIQFFQFFIHLIGGLIQELIFMCVLIFLCFFFLSGRADFLLIDGERGACGCTWCWYGRFEAYFGKDRAAKEHVACPINKEKFD